jgi:hypothetical protein
MLKIHNIAIIGYKTNIFMIKLTSRRSRGFWYGVQALRGGA